MALHLVKLCVGCDSVEALAARRPPTGPPWRLTTRMAPRRADEIVPGGSLYWVFRGQVLCRQEILAIESAETGERRCALLLDPALVLTAPLGRRPFQGWRYLEADDAPPDLADGAGAAVPADLARRLREIGAW